MCVAARLSQAHRSRGPGPGRGSPGGAGKAGGRGQCGYMAGPEPQAPCKELGTTVAPRDPVQSEST